jgi:hypothetical protein
VLVMPQAGAADTSSIKDECFCLTNKPAGHVQIVELPFRSYQGETIDSWQ